MPLTRALDAEGVADALHTASDRWAEADIGDYRLNVAEDRNFWSAGCRWSTEILGGDVSESQIDPASTSSECPPIEWTVEQLHEMIAGWLATIDEFASPEFGEHTLVVEFNEIGVPVALEFDLANGNDEESSIGVTFTPID